jgi:hypothetical protein
MIDNLFKVRVRVSETVREFTTLENGSVFVEAERDAAGDDHRPPDKPEKLMVKLSSDRAMTLGHPGSGRRFRGKKVCEAQLIVEAQPGLRSRSRGTEADKIDRDTRASASRTDPEAVAGRTYTRPGETMDDAAARVAAAAEVTSLPATPENDPPATDDPGRAADDGPNPEGPPPEARDHASE